jgi:hypothetical protein
MANEKKAETRVIYKKDLTLSRTECSDYPEAKAIEAELLGKYPEPGHRVRTRLRTRTSTWDVVVKVRTEVTA